MISSKQELYQIMKKQEWKFAKTMPKYPHHYTLKQTWDDKELFQECVYFIRGRGVMQKFFKKSLIYLYVEDIKLWTMDDSPEKVVLINLAKVK